MSAPLTLFNSLTRATEGLHAYRSGDGCASIPAARRSTTSPHLGNLRAYVFTDTLRRVLNWKG